MTTQVPGLEAERGEYLLEQGDIDGLAQYLTTLPSAIVEKQPRLLRLRGHILWHEQDIEAAFMVVERARYLAIQDESWQFASRCALDLSRWYQSRDDILQARNYLGLAGSDLGLAPNATDKAQADLALAIGRLSPDLGRNGLAVTWCTRALVNYEALHDAEGVVLALWTLSVANQYLGHLSEAERQIERAIIVRRAAELDPTLDLYLLNTKAGSQLNAGKMKSGLLVIDEARDLLRQYPYTKASLYVYTTEADLLRLLNRYTDSLAALRRAEAILDHMGDAGFRPWLEMDVQWTKVLAGESAVLARLSLLKMMELQADILVKMFMTAEIAVLEVLARQWIDVEQRLLLLCDEFHEAQWPFVEMAIHTFLAYMYLHTGRIMAFEREAEAALGWAESAGVDGFSWLWHPDVMAEICVECYMRDIRTRQAELMIHRRLADPATPHLMTHLQTGSALRQQKLRELLLSLDEHGVWVMLENLERSEPYLGTAIREHLEHGRLSLQMLRELHIRLRGKGDGQAWERVAVFGYYIGTDLSRLQIANKLGIPDGTVKKHITTLRQVFGVEIATGRDSGGRLLVRDLARAEGYLPSTMGTLK